MAFAIPEYKSDEHVLVWLIPQNAPIGVVAELSAYERLILGSLAKRGRSFNEEFDTDDYFSNMIVSTSYVDRVTMATCRIAVSNSHAESGKCICNAKDVTISFLRGCINVAGNVYFRDANVIENEPAANNQCCVNALEMIAASRSLITPTKLLNLCRQTLQGVIKSLEIPVVIGNLIAEYALGDEKNSSTFRPSEELFQILNNRARMLDLDYLKWQNFEEIKNYSERFFPSEGQSLAHMEPTKFVYCVVGYYDNVLGLEGVYSDIHRAIYECTVIRTYVLRKINSESMFRKSKRSIKLRVVQISTDGGLLSKNLSLNPPCDVSQNMVYVPPNDSCSRIMYCTVTAAGLKFFHEAAEAIKESQHSSIIIDNVWSTITIRDVQCGHLNDPFGSWQNLR